MSFENLCRVIISFENYSKHCEGSHYKRKWLLSESRGYGTLGIQLKKKKSQIESQFNWTLVWSRADYETNRLAESQSQSKILF